MTHIALEGCGAKGMYEKDIKFGNNDGFLGQGTYGVVKAYTHKHSGDLVAIKKIRLGDFKTGVNITAVREIKCLQEFNHENIVRLRDVFIHKLNINLVFDFLPVDLEKLIKDRRCEIRTQDIKTMMKMMLQGVQYLHNHWVMHRDLKPGNVLINANKMLKLADFGLARAFGSPERNMSHQAVTRWYRAPELLFGAKSYGGAVDMWSMGCIFGELMARKPYMPGDSDIGQLKVIFQALGTPTEEDWPNMKYLDTYLPHEPIVAPDMMRTFPGVQRDALDFLKKLLMFDPTKRLEVGQALEHEYFSNSPAPTPQQNLPMPAEKKSLGDSGLSSLGSSARSTRPSARMMDSPISALHFPTPSPAQDPRAQLNNSFGSSASGAGSTPQSLAGFDTCGMPINKSKPRVCPDTETRKRKLDMNSVLEEEEMDNNSEGAAPEGESMIADDL